MIKNTPSIQQFIEQLRLTHLFNMAMSDQMIRFLLLKQEFVSKAAVTRMMKAHHLNEVNEYRRVLISKWSKNSNLKVKKDLLAYVITQSLNHLDATLLTSNPYYQLVKPLPIKKGQWELTYMTYEPYQGLLVGDVAPQAKHHYLELTPLGYFKEPLPYLVILQGDVVWMSVTPFEIKTMQPVLDLVNGSVLTFGLGLGYFAGMAAMKEEVTSVVVVERDPQAIELFMRSIYPLLPHKEKITIINQDAFLYIKKNKKKFNHVFVDIYHTAEDGLPIYIQMKKYEQFNEIGTWHYWLEASILSLFRRYLILFLNEQMNALPSEYYTKTETFEDQLFRGMYLVTSQIPINRVKDVKQLLEIPKLINLIESIDIA
jgi:hypothetical protein